MLYLKSRGPGPPPLKAVRIIHNERRFVPLILRAFVISSVVLTVSTERNKYFDMKTLCQGQFMGQANYQIIDGAVVTSKNERNLDCVITFQTLSVLQRFMLRFERLKIDCNDHLYIYDVANAVGSFKADLTCHNTTEAFGVMFMSGNYVTLRYVTDAWGTELNGFELLITAFKNQTAQSCSDFRCTHKNHCISKDLICDGLNHCLDGSDETLHCNNAHPFQFFGFSLSTVIIAVICSGLFLLVLCVTLIVCLCRTGKQQPSPRHLQSNAANSNLGFPLENTYNANGNTIGPGETNLLGYNNINHTRKMPGNWGHPAGLKLGYSEVRVRLYCQAK